MRRPDTDFQVYPPDVITHCWHNTSPASQAVLNEFKHTAFSTAYWPDYYVYAWRIIIGNGCLVCMDGQAFNDKSLAHVN